MKQSIFLSSVVTDRVKEHDRSGGVGELPGGT